MNATFISAAFDSGRGSGRPSAMAQYRNQKFADQEIHVDGNEYHDCRFDNCVLVYSGGQLPKITGCSFARPKWRFSGAAADTLLLMSQLYHGGFQPIIEKTLQNIREGVPVALLN